MNHQEIKDAFDLFYATHNIDYDGRKHQYKLEGITCAGVSTISDFRPSPFLIPWAAKMVVEHLKDKREAIAKMTQEEFDALLLEAKKMHKTKSDEAKEIGTAVHDWCENHIKGKDLPVTKETMSSIGEFVKFELQHKVEWICTEKIVCSPSYLVAGRLDSLAFVDNILSVVDLKTSSRIGESYFLQTAGYALCLSEMGIPAERRLIVRLPKAAEDCLEACEVTTPLKDDVEAFLGQRRAYAWHNMVDMKYSEKTDNGNFVETKLKLKKI